MDSVSSRNVQVLCVRHPSKEGANDTDLFVFVFPGVGTGSTDVPSGGAKCP